MVAAFRSFLKYALCLFAILTLVACSRSQDIGNPQQVAAEAEAVCPVTTDGIAFLNSFALRANVAGSVAEQNIPLLQVGTTELGYSPDINQYTIVLPAFVNNVTLAADAILTSTGGDISSVNLVYTAISIRDGELVREPVASEEGLSGLVSLFPDFPASDYIDTRTLFLELEITATVRNSLVYRTCFPESVPEDGSSEIVTTLSVNVIRGVSRQEIASTMPLSSGDAFGYSIAIDDTTMVVGSPGVDNGAALFLGVNRIVRDNNGAFELETGESLQTIKDDTSSPDSGLVYVFELEERDWILTQILKHESPDSGDEFGAAVALDGNVLVVSVPGEDSVSEGVGGVETNNTAEDSGAVFVYERSESSPVWQKSAFLKTPSNTTGVDFYQDDFGIAVAVSGNEVFVGAPREEGSSSDGVTVNSGAVYIYSNASGDWMFSGRLIPSLLASGSQFGRSLDVEGDSLVVGAPGDASDHVGPVFGSALDDWFDESFDNFELTSADSGAAYYYDKVLGIWTLRAYLKAPNADAEDRFGESVALNSLGGFAIGAPQEDGSGLGLNRNMDTDDTLNSGAVYTYLKAAAVQGEFDAFNFQDYIKPTTSNSGANFGASLAMDNELVVVGANEFSGTANTLGRVDIYRYIDDEDSADNISLISGLVFEDDFSSQEERTGHAVDTAGGRVALSAPNSTIDTTDALGNALSTEADAGAVSIQF